MDYDSNYKNPSVHHFTDMYTLPFSLAVPQETTITLARNRFYKPPNEYHAMLDISPGEINYISVNREDGVQT